MMTNTKAYQKEIQKINPNLTMEECSLIHEYMNDMAFVLEKINMDNFNLLYFKSSFEEHFLKYNCSYATIVDVKNASKEMSSVIVSVEGLEFNIFLEDEIKVIVFRKDDPYRNIFVISVSNKPLN